MGTTVPQRSLRQENDEAAEDDQRRQRCDAFTKLAPRRRRRRAAAANSMISGATVTIPSASDANQCCHVVRTGAVELWKYENPAVPPIPETAVATTAAASSPSTWLSLSRLKPDPK